MNNIPAGLESKGVEIYAYDNKIKAIYDGRVIDFVSLPDHIKEVFQDQCFANDKALKAMHAVGITNPEALVNQFVFCNYGGFNNEADIAEDGKLSSEFWDCGKRNHCPFNGAICGAIKGENGIITNREIEVIKLIKQGLLNKEIAAALKISVNTVNNHIQHINQKTGTGNRAEIINWAIKNNLL